MTPNESFCCEWPLDDVHPVTQLEISLELLSKGTLLTLTDGDYQAELKNAAHFHSIVQRWTDYLWNLRAVSMFSAVLPNEWE